MFQKTLICFCLALFLVSSSGCATTRRKNDLEAQGLRNQITALEAQVQAKDEEINSLRESLSSASTQEAAEAGVSAKKKSKKRIIAEVKSRPNAKQIQIALENAGFNPGSIDGNMGKQTRDAIRAFQEANNLSADGKVGKQTWKLLREYLYKKIK
jgi:peptidoglycan hydrolase-like protein with peptidoglycan-binding domain